MSLGELVDRLSVTNLKIWHLQDWVHAASSQSPESFAKANDLAGVQAKLKLLGDLNKERNRLMDEIDALSGTLHGPRTKV